MLLLSQLVPVPREDPEKYTLQVFLVTTLTPTFPPYCACSSASLFALIASRSSSAMFDSGFGPCQPLPQLGARDFASRSIFSMVFSVACFCLIVAVVFGASPATARSNGDALNFVMLGDWGGQQDSPYTTKAELEVADKMGDIAEQIGSQFTIALGDNFYHDGVKDVNDHRFQVTFEVKIIVN